MALWFWQDVYQDLHVQLFSAGYLCIGVWWRLLARALCGHMEKQLFPLRQAQV